MLSELGMNSEQKLPTLTSSRLLLRQLSISEMEKEATRILGGHVKIVLCPHAELGMDADKPAQVELLQKEFM